MLRYSCYTNENMFCHYQPRTLFTWDKKREEEEAQRATDQLTWDKRRQEEEAQRATDLLIAANLVSQNK